MRVTLAKPSPARIRAGAIAAVVAGVALWGASNILVKDASVGGLTFAVARVWVGFAALALVGLAARKRLTPTVIKASLPGGILFGIDLVLFFEAIRRSTIANVTLITALQPALVFLVASRTMGERVTRWDVGWTALSLAGIGAVVVGSFGAPGWHPSGDLLAVAALVIWSWYFIASKRVRSNLGTIEYFTAVLGISGVVLTPLMFLSGGSFAEPTARDWILIAAVALGPGTLGHLLVTWAHRHLDVSLSSVILVCQPVVATAMAAAFLGEVVTGLQIAGGLVTVVAVGAVVGRRRIPEPELPPESAP